jgi:importin subunit beta-1
VAKEDSLQQAKHDAWKQLAEETRGQIKSTLLKTLLSPETTARHTAAQACAEVAAVELPFQAWNEFLPTIVDYITNNTHPDVVKISSLECLGFTCERIASLEDESIPEITPAVTDKMLTAIVDGMQETRADSIRLSATIALKNSLLFTKKNMESIDERNIIMQAICQATQSKDVKVRASSFECLVQIAYQYYDKLSDYMNALFQLTTKAIEMDEEEVALNAIEFWSTICEEEMDILDEIADGINDRQCMKYVEGALPNLGPLLTNTLTKQDEDSAGDEDIWNLSMSAATCIGLIANTTEDKVVPVITPFVQQHIQSQDWRFREAAVMAFGSILEGPSSEIIGPFVNQSIPILLGALSDSHAMVKDTAAWTIGRICELHVRAIPTDTFPTLLTSLMEKLQQESPQVAGQAAYALHNLAAAFQMEDASDTNALSQYMSTLLGELLKATERSDADEGNLRPSAFEAISVLIQSAAEDCTPILVSLLPALVTKLQQSFNISVLTGADKERKEAIQGLLCGLIQALIYKLDLSDVEPHADSIMTCFLQVLQIQNATCHQEAFTATSALCDKMEIKFNVSMQQIIIPFLSCDFTHPHSFLSIM